MTNAEFKKHLEENSGSVAGGIICGVIGAVAGAYYGWNYI
ncbi:hypothetical protein MSI_01420 [Treponema sp. JC4]|nr:hypothetical protein MSI_01420 [Treponema sp. JC4]